LRRTSRVLSWLRTDEAGPRPPTDLCEIKTGISLYFLNIFQTVSKPAESNIAVPLYGSGFATPCRKCPWLAGNMYLTKTIF
jgi:hypothetical protein